MTSRLPLLAVLAIALASGGAFAQTAATPSAAAPAAPMSAAPMAPMAKKAPKPRTAQSLECSKKADVANVHGKPRSAFMRKCKSGKA